MKLKKAPREYSLKISKEEFREMLLDWLKKNGEQIEDIPAEFLYAEDVGMDWGFPSRNKVAVQIFWTFHY